MNQQIPMIHILVKFSSRMSVVIKQTGNVTVWNGVAVEHCADGQIVFGPASHKACVNYIVDTCKKRDKI